MSTQQPGEQDWVPRADMAALMRKSEDTVRRVVKANGLATRDGDAGRVLVCVGDFLRLGHVRPEDLLPGGTAAESVEVLRARDTITALTVQVGELTGRLANTDTLVATLRQQLDAKDRQLAKQADQVSQLTTAITRLATMGSAA